LQKESRVWNSY